MTLALALQAALVAAGLVLAAFCWELSRRLRKLNDLETGLGGAIAVMAAEIARLHADPEEARRLAQASRARVAADFHHRRSAQAVADGLARTVPGAAEAMGAARPAAPASAAAAGA